MRQEEKEQSVTRREAMAMCDEEECHCVSAWSTLLVE